MTNINENTDTNGGYGSYQNMFVISVIMSTITAMFSSTIQNFIRYIYDWVLSWIYVKVTIYDNDNPEFVRDIYHYLRTTLVENKSNQIYNNGQYSLPLNDYYIYKNIWCSMSIELWGRSDKNCLIHSVHMHFIFRWRVNQRFTNFKKLIQNSNKDRMSKEYSTTDTIMIYKDIQHGDEWRVGKRIPCVLPELYVNQQILDNITKFCSDFYKNKIDYLRRGIPYRKTMLLLGPPGTGKSTLIRWLAIQYKKNIYSLEFKMLDEYPIYSMKDGIIILEDFDRYIRSLKTEIKPNPDISKVLNFLDGLSSPENCIIIITANDISDIPDVVFRPGRITMRVDMPLLTEEVYKMIANKYDIDKKYNKRVHGGMSISKFLLPYQYKNL
jgi:hypothetical protein